MNSYLQKLLLTLFTLCASMLARAADANWYQIEIIAFENLQANLAAETWNEFDLILPHNTIELNVTDASADGFVSLSYNELHLNEIYQRLQASDQYRIIYYSGWRQPVLTKTEAKPIHIFGGKSFANKALSQDKFWFDYDPKIMYEFDAIITPSLSNYLHLDTNISFHKPKQRFDNLNTTNTKQNFYNFNIAENRKIKVKQMYYFDHPAFGVIIEALPL